MGEQLETDSLALKLFAAWCGTTPGHAATKDAWIKGLASQHTRNGWKRVADAAQETAQRQLAELRSARIATILDAPDLVDKLIDAFMAMERGSKFVGNEEFAKTAVAVICEAVAAPAPEPTMEPEVEG